MSELFSRQQWEIEFKAFCQFHRWINYSNSFANAPGWLRLVANCVNEIEEILQTETIYTKVLVRQEWEEIFDASLSEDVASKLAELSPRRMQSEIEAALGRVTKAGRRVMLLEDIGDMESSNSKRRIGFY